MAAPQQPATVAPPVELPLVSPDELRVAPGVLIPVNRGPDAVQCDLNGYLRRILTARVYEIAVRSWGVRLRHSQPLGLLPPLPSPTAC